MKSSVVKSQWGLRSSKPRAARAIQMAARKTILGFVAAPCALPGAKRSGRAASRLARACDQRLTLCARRRPCLCACLLAATFGEVSELAKLNVVAQEDEPQKVDRWMYVKHLDCYVCLATDWLIFEQPRFING